MPAKSKKQQQAAGVALAAKRGEKDVSELKGAAKEMYDSMSEKELEDFASSVKEESVVDDSDILTESQKKELKKIIDTLVEERVQEKNKAFVKKYTQFVAESAASKIQKKLQESVTNKIDRKMKQITEEAEKICRSAILQSGNKVAKMKKVQEELVNHFKETAPKLVEKLAEEQAKELASDAILAIEERDQLKESFDAIARGMGKAGFVINEDLDKAIEKERNEKRMLRTKLVEAQRNLKISQLTEGMLPAQKREVETLLEDCTTPEMVESRFLVVKKKVMDANSVIEEDDTRKNSQEVEAAKKVFNEEQILGEFLSEVRKAKVI